MITQNDAAQKSIATERHYSPREVAAIYNVSVDTIIRWFRDVPGVIVVGRGRKLTMRIPESSLLWFHENHRSKK